MSKEKQKQRKKEAQKKAIKNAVRELKKVIPPANYRTFSGESKDRLVVDLRNIDVTDDKKLTMGFLKPLVCQFLPI
jgi:hypothetical protein